MLFAAAYLLFSTLTSIGLLAIWAARSRWHWFWRTMILLGVAALPVLIPAYELFVAFAVQGAVVAAGVQAARWAKRRRERRLRGEPRPVPQFSLRDALLVVVPVACLSAIGVRLPALDAPTWLSLVGAGAIAGVATLLALWVVRGERLAWWGRGLIALPLGLMLAAPLSIADQALNSVVYLWGWPPGDPSQVWMGLDEIGNPAWLGVMLSLAGCLVLLLWCAVPWAGCDPRRKRLLRWATVPMLLVLSVFLLAPPLGVFYQLMNPLPIPKHELLEPNGYDDFLAATKLLPANPISDGPNFDSKTAPLATLQAADAEMRSAMDLVLKGLTKEAWKEQEYGSDDLSMVEIQGFRSLARGFDAAAKYHEMAGQPLEAAETYLDLIDYGNSVGRGGLLVDGLVGIACSGIGCSGLYDMRDSVPTEMFPRIVARLEATEGLLEENDEVNHRDKVWTQRAYGWHGHTCLILGDISGEQMWWSNSGIQAYQRHQAQLRLLKLEFALRLWKEEHGEWPESLDQLVPAILPAVPLDPYDPAGKPLRYKRTDEGFLLYSVGQNGVDEGGKPLDREAYWSEPSVGDFQLEGLYAPDPVEEPEADDEEWMEEPEEEEFNEKDSNDAVPPEK